MNKRAVVAILLVLCLITASPALGLPLTSDMTQPAYVGKGNLVYLAGATQPSSVLPVRALLYADENTLIYERATATRTTLYALPLGGVSATTIANLALEALYCAADGLIYYVDADDPAHLKALQPQSLKVTTLVDAGAAIEALALSADGPLVTSGGLARVYALGKLSDSPISYADLSV
ncbi:MAG: hypothetical protein RR739_06700, partial [Clostridia bacterium]